MSFCSFLSICFHVSAYPALKKAKGFALCSRKSSQNNELQIKFHSPPSMRELTLLVSWLEFRDSITIRGMLL